MGSLDISDLTRAMVAQVSGGLAADVIQLKVEIALLGNEIAHLRAENAMLKKSQDAPAESGKQES